MRRLARLLRVGGIAALVTSALVLTAALVAEHLLSTTVQLVAHKEADVVALDRELWQPGEPVAPIYGTPLGQPVQVVLPDEQHLIRPQEAPALLLLQVNKQRGDNPLQLKTVWFVAWRVALGLGLVALLAWSGGAWLGRRQRRKPGSSLAADGSS